MAADRDNKTSAYAQRIADQLITQLEAGTAPWQKPWAPGEQILPHNAVSGRPYRGSNAIALMLEGQSRGFSDPRWLTYRQAQGIGGQVRKGEKGTLIRFYKFEGQEPVVGADGQPTRGSDGQVITHKVRYDRPQMFSAIVFNADQCNGLPVLAPPLTMSESMRHERSEALLAAIGADIRYDQGDRAFYRPATDSIHMPPTAQFNSPDAYYATALHEVGHWTGHPARLDRDLSHPFGSAGYAREELRAEIASLMIGQELEIGHDPGQHAAYVQSWIQTLREDPTEILRACADAERITKHVLGVERGIEQTRDELETKMEQLDGTKSRALLFDLTSEKRQELVDAFPVAVSITAARANGKYVGPLHLTDDGELLLQRVGQGSYVAHEAGVLLPALVSGEFNQPADYELEDVLRADPWRTVEYHDRTASASAVPEAQIATKKGRWAAISDAQWAEQGIGSENKVVVNEALQVAGKLGASPLLRENPFLNEALRGAWDDARAQSRGEQVPPTRVRSEDLPGRSGEMFRQELAERLKQSTLTPGEYSPSETMRQYDHVAIYAGEDAVLVMILGPADDQESKDIAGRLVNDPEFRRIVSAQHPEAGAILGVGTYTDGQGGVSLPDRMAALVRKPAGQVELGGDDGPLVAAIPGNSDRDKALATALASSNSVLHCIDPNAPQLGQPEARDLSRQPLVVPYAQRDQAKALGAKWDRAAKTWYAPADLEPAKLEALQRWHPDRAETKTIETPAQEFGRALRAAGLQIEGEPVMDGTMQRVPVAGDVGKETSGSYVGHSDGHPAGYIQNFKQDIAENWKYSGRSESLTDVDRARAETEAKQKLQERQAARDAAHLSAAARAQWAWEDAKPLSNLDPAGAAWPKYLVDKGIDQPVHNVRVTEDGKLLVPAQDADGKIWSVQTIDDAGEKSFMKGGRKAGCFVEISPPADNSAQVIGIAEGMATAATLTQCAPGEPAMAVYVAFDAYNLRAAAETLAAKHPGTPIVIFGDDDTGKKKNVGRSKAEEAAKAVGGVAAFPKFAVGLTGKDFNDLGKADAAAVTAQIREVVGRALRLDKAADIANERAKSQTLEKSQEKELKRERKRSHSLER